MLLGANSSDTLTGWMGMGNFISYQGCLFVADDQCYITSAPGSLSQGSPGNLKCQAFNNTALRYQFFCLGASFLP
jgi:hypothetical protein